jgi:hypothetical protein
VTVNPASATPSVPNPVKKVHLLATGSEVLATASLTSLEKIVTNAKTVSSTYEAAKGASFATATLLVLTIKPAMSIPGSASADQELQGELWLLNSSEVLNS